MWDVLRIAAALIGWPLGVTFALAGAIRLTVRPDRCPSCNVRAVQCWRFSRNHPRPIHGFYRCERCGVRLRRLLGGPWEDASALAYDAYYENAPPLPLPPAGSYRA